MNGKISAPTVRKFLEYGVEAFLISELLPFYAKPRRRIKSDRKAYVIDNGFFSARQIGVLEDHGRLLENLVFVELWRRGHRPNLDLFYYVTKGNHEVDFLVRDGHRNLELIQASISLGNQKTKERELRALANAAQELKVSKLTVVTLDQERIEKLDAFEINIKSVASWCGKE